MAYFSSFWYKHYKELRNCCMTEPLITSPLIKEGNKVPTDLQNKLIRDLIDTGWMSEKGLKWFGWDVDGWYAWTDSNGMIYRIRDLKRNENGKRFEKEVTKIARNDEPRNDIHANANQLYQHEFNLCVDCQLCPDRSGVLDGDDETDTSTDAGGGAKEEDINVTAPPWQTFAGGGAPDYGGINTGSNPNVPGGNYGGYGDGYTDYTSPTTNPGDTVKTDGVTDATKAAGGSNTPAKEGGKTSTSIDVTKSPAAPPPKHGSDIGKDIKIREEAKIDKLRVKPNIPPENKDIKFPTPSKPIKDADEWFKQPEQNPAKNPKQADDKEKGKDSKNNEKESIKSSFDSNDLKENKTKNFTKEDAIKALNIIHKKYGREMAETIERMYRDETAHFTSGQYKHTGTGGMEVGKWDTNLYKDYPEYAPIGKWSAYENKGSSGIGGNKQVTDRPKVFLVFPSVEAAMIYKAEYINRHGGNFARWHSTDKSTQDFYRNKLLKIRTPIVNSF